MKKVVHIALGGVILLVFSSNISGQDAFFASTDADNGTIEHIFQTEVDHFSDQLAKKRDKYKNEIDFLRFVYYKVHRKYLGFYKTPSTLQSLFEKRTYDCLTGTALYSIIFEKLGLDYQIMETTYHVYLTVKAAGDMVLIESTSPLEGFISDPVLISRTLEQYEQDENQSNGIGKEYYKFDQPVHNEITLTQLAGLQFHNLAIEAYNNRNLRSALILQEQALHHYPSVRLKEIMAVMLNTLSEDDTVDPAFKQKYLSGYDNLRHLLVTASREF